MPTIPAIVVRSFGDPSVLRAEQVSAPKPGPGQVLLRVHAAGVNPVDTYIRAGQYAKLPPLPYTPGMDGAGEVLALGDGVATARPDLRVGSRVWCFRSVTGTYAAQCVCEAAHVAPLPEGVGFDAGACLGVPALTAWQALHHKAQVRAGETVLVRGASGGVGLACVQLARDAGARVLATASPGPGAQLARDAGAHEVLPHALEAMPSSSPAAPDVIVEMLANVNLASDLALLAPRGRIVIVGNRGEVTINPRAAMGKDATILGMSLFNITPDELAHAQQGVCAAAQRGVLRPSIRAAMPLDRAPDAHALVMAPGSQGKIILLPGASA